MLTRWSVLLLFAFTMAAARAITPAPPRLMESIDAETPVRLQSLRIHGEIAGGMAETTVRMVFFNPNGRMLEGQLQFPLLAGQQVTAFALDIDGKLRPAVPVEKAKGRQIFEAVERRKVDPGLLEQTQGNNFKLRVYPIPAMGTRTIELKYTEAMGREGKSWQYRLPLAYGERLQDFDLSVNIRGSGDAPKASGAFGAVRFNRDARGYFTHVAKSRFAPSGVLDILIPTAQHTLTYIGEHDDDTYFVAEIPVAATRSARPLPRVVGLLWDSSGSGVGRPHEAELAELDRYFKALGNAEVRLTRLRDRSEAAGSFRIAGGNWDELRTALQATVYDGASALADWLPQADVNEYLLVSDGLLNYGSDRFPALAAGQRLYALNSSLVADTGRLAALAERSSGRLVQVSPGKPGTAAEALLTDASYVRSVRAEGATAILSDAGGARQGLVRVAGKLLAPAAKLMITVVEQGKPREMAVAVSASDQKHELVPALWAGYQLRALESDYEANRGAIRRLGAQFAIPTRETSLIVLDRLDDYVRYDVTPPEDYLAEYVQMKLMRRVQLQEKRRKHLERIVSDFNQKVAWWEKTYPKDAPPTPKPEPRPDTRAYAPAPVAAAAPMAMAPAPAPVSALMGGAPALPQAGAAPEIGISLKKWTSDAPYIARMQAASADTIYQVYLDEKPSYANSSAFYLDAADMLFDKGLRELALRVLSNLAEMDLENRHVLRILGYRLLQAGAPELAVPVFEKVQYLAEEEPQSFRDLGLAQAAAGHPQQAIDQLNEVIVRPWDNRFAEIELIALAEMNAIIATSTPPLDTSRIDPRLLKNLPLDIRAVLTWDADNSDMDLWVTDPNGEKCYYGHRFTYQGGRMSLDFTGGYGPEEFSLREAKPGKYKIEANFFGSSQQVVAGATTLQVTLSSGFGTPAAKEKMLTLRLKGRGQSVFVGEFEVKPK
ncbi:VIT domain-containing protein [Herbaspirillum sp.]|uniref:VIT domain-containing protein n=1 Tax=Herbaspirillum sp. TaxID=1890675 RepID=UPI0031D19391